MFISRKYNCKKQRQNQINAYEIHNSYTEKTSGIKKLQLAQLKIMNKSKAYRKHIYMYIEKGKLITYVIH